MLLFLALLVNVAFGGEFTCNFEQDFCKGENLNGDNFDWTRRSGTTPSSGTGPSSGNGGNGYYAYIETSSPRVNGDIAKLKFKPTEPVSDKICISFHYHMLGRDVRALKVYVNGKEKFKKTGSQGNKWIKAEFSVQERLKNIVFEGIRGTSWQGDIAIDDLKVKDCGSSPPPTQAPPPPPGSCGVRPSTRIVGGTAAKHGDWPWQAMIRSKFGFPFCGGTLVAPQWVVTATHCVQGKSASSVFVRLGAHKRTSTVGTEQDFKVSKVITHSSYHQPVLYSNDIALLKLEKPAVLNRNVNLACLPNNVNAPGDGVNCWITGWGTLSSGGATPDILQQVSVPIVSRARCDKAYPGQIHDSMICAGLDKGGIDACQGDSGGPMVCESGGRYYLHGATSWGYGCAAAGRFGVYAKVKYLMSWLNSEMANN